jgi:hypothetical protein
LADLTDRPANKSAAAWNEVLNKGVVGGCGSGAVAATQVGCEFNIFIFIFIFFEMLKLVL